FGIDVQLPDLRTAVVARPPAFGATLVDFDAAAALRVPGVEQVVPTATGVAVVAKHFWAAKLGRDALVVRWRDPEGNGFDSMNHTTFLGGGFGRRANPQSDFVAEAVVVAKNAGVPVKVVWTREDDIRGGWYRPAYVHRVRVAVDASGSPVAWDHVVAGQSILTGTVFERFAVRNGIDGSSVEGLADSPYLAMTQARRLSLHSPQTPVPVQWWRSVGNTHTAFALESMVDELAHAAGKDPLDYRLALLAKAPRHAAAL